MNEKRVQVTYIESAVMTLRRVLCARANRFVLRELVYHPATKQLAATYALKEAPK